MVKVLVAGDVRGRVDALAARVAKVTAKTPFDLLFCVGDFLDPDGDHDKVYALLKHQIEFALPTFIVSSGTDDWATVLGADAMTDEDGRITLTQNVQFLGRAGVFNAGGLQVAYVSGSYDALNYRAGRPDALDFSSYRADHIDGIKQSAASKQIDLLLTSEWPRSWHEGIALLPALPKQPAPRRFGAPPVADLCKHLKPRYHFAAGQDVFYQRVPYANPNVQHVTRFLSLAQVGNSGNEKYLYAFNCLPQSDAGYAASVLNVPPETTRNPFLQADLIAEKRKRPGLGEATANAGIDNTRFQLSGAQASAVRQDHQRKLQKQQQKYGVTPTAPAQQQQQQQQHGNQGNHPQAKRPHHDNPNLKMHNRPTDCWFCLASPKVEKHLVVAVGKLVYVALAKGPLNDYHVLVLPIEHTVSAVASMPAAVAAEMHATRDALIKYFQANGRPHVVVYERNIVNMRRPAHSHLQVVAFAADETTPDAAHGHFATEGKAAGIRWDELAAGQALDAATLGNGFLHVLLPDGRQLLHVIPEGARHPMQFARHVCATVMGKPERVEWQKCAQSIEEETAVTKRIRALFQPFQPKN